MTPHTDALEAFNRASLDPQTPKIVPAEELQADERPTPRSILATIPARDFFASVGIAVTLWVVAAGFAAVLP